MKNKKIRNDVLLVIIILVVAMGVFVLFKNTLKTGEIVIVRVDNRTVLSAPLGENYTRKIETDKGYNIIEIKDGSVSVIEADCRDKICKNHRPIKEAGETVVCLPHKLTVEIEGEKE